MIGKKIKILPFTLVCLVTSMNAEVISLGTGTITHTVKSVSGPSDENPTIYGQSCRTDQVGDVYTYSLSISVDKVTKELIISGFPSGYADNLKVKSDGLVFFTFQLPKVETIGTGGGCSFVDTEEFKGRFLSANINREFVATHYETSTNTCTNGDVTSTVSCTVTAEVTGRFSPLIEVENSDSLFRKLQGYARKYKVNTDASTGVKFKVKDKAPITGVRG